MRRGLDHVEIPGEHDARERTWQIVSTAFADRVPTTRRPVHRLVPALAAVVVAGAVAAAAVTSPGRALVRSLRESIGVENAKPALFSLPTAGRLLVASDAGVWVVQADGSKRRLGSYDSAAWSPNGLFVAATRPNGLFTLTPSGEERWSLARPAVRSPRWVGSRTDTRIAYASRNELRVVAGDGTGDTSLATAPELSRAPFAWRSGTRSLAYALPDRALLQVVDADARGKKLWSRRVPQVTKLAWSSDGGRLLVMTRRELRIYTAGGRLVRQRRAAAGTAFADAEFLPHSRAVVLLRSRGQRTDLVRFPGGSLLFHANGELRDLTWSPNGAWLVVGWPAADQFVFLRITNAGTTRRLTAASNIASQFRSRAFPRIEGWAPPPS